MNEVDEKTLAFLASLNCPINVEIRTAVQFNSDWYTVHYRNGGTEVYRDGQGLLFVYRGRLSEDAIRVGIAAYDRGYEDGRESLTPEPDWVHRGYGQ